MLSKESKIRVLENFYALDYVFFGKPVNELDTCCPLIREEYLSVKGALMSVFVEMMKLVDHKPNNKNERVNSKDLMKNARSSATIARENSQSIVSSPKARKNIKGMLKEVLTDDPKADVAGMVERTIRTKAFGLAVDNLLIARSLNESKSFDKLNKWEGQIVEDSYKILRDSLVEAAHLLLYDDDIENIEEGWKLGALLGFLTPIPGGIIAGGVIGKWLSSNKKKLQNYCAKQEDVEGCLLAGKDAMKYTLQQAKEKQAKEKQNQES